MKFKAWDIINKKWLDVYQLILAKNGEVMSVVTLDGEAYGLHQVELTASETTQCLPNQKK